MVLSSWVYLRPGLAGLVDRWSIWIVGMGVVRDTQECLYMDGAFESYLSVEEFVSVCSSVWASIRNTLPWHVCMYYGGPE
jgi:hypothetical protein